MTGPVATSAAESSGRKEQKVDEQEQKLLRKAEELTHREELLEANLATVQGVKVIGWSLCLLAAMAVLGGFFWTFTAAMDTDGSERIGLVQGALAGIGGSLIAGFAGWRAWALDSQVKLSREELEHEREKEKARRRDEQQRIERERERENALSSGEARKRLDQRFGESAVLIGHEREDTRIAGLLALERLLKEDQFADEHWTIVQLLQSFIRGRRWEAPSFGEACPLDQDTQVALSVLGRRPRGRAEGQLDFAGFHLESIVLSGAHFEGAFLARAHFEHAHLHAVHLEGAFLGKAYFAKAGLCNARLEGAMLEGADLEEANLEGANLEGANLEGANLEGANLEGANLEGANLKGANLEGANLKGANLKGAHVDGGTQVSREQLESATSVPESAWKLGEETDPRYLTPPQAGDV